MHRKEKKRVTIAFILSIIAHAVILIGLGLFISFAPAEDIKNMGPVFVQLESDLVVPPEAQEDKPVPEKDQPQPEERKPIEPQSPSEDKKKVVQNVKPPEPEEKPDVPRTEVEENPEMSRESDVSENSLPEATQVRTTSAPQPTEAPTATGTPTPTPTVKSEINPDLLSQFDSLEQSSGDNPDGSVDNSETDDVAESEDSSQAYPDESSGATFYTIGSKIREITHAEPVVLPDWVRKRGLSLFVKFDFTLMPDGTLVNIQNIESSGYTDVDEAVKAALQKYIIEPSTTNEIIQGEVSFPITPK